MSKIIRLKVETGFGGAVHEDEVPYEGQTEEEMEQLAIEYREEVCCNYIECSYELEEDED